MNDLNELARTVFMSLTVTTDEMQAGGEAVDIRTLVADDLGELFAQPHEGALALLRLMDVVVGIAAQLTGEERVTIARWACEFSEQQEAQRE